MKDNIDYELIAAVCSIIDTHGEGIIDDRERFISLFENSAPELKHKTKQINSAISSGAVMILASAVNDDEIGQKNAGIIALGIMQNEAGAEPEEAMEAVIAFSTALGYSFGKENSTQLFNRAYNLYKSGELEKAFVIFSKLADNGNTESQNLLGYMYYTGKGTPQNYKKAIRYFTLASENGNTSAQFNLGNMYLNGNGTDKSTDKAAKLWTKSADNGHAMAQYNLSMLFSRGIGVEKNSKLADKYLMLAAKQNFTPAVKLFSQTKNEKTKIDEETLKTLFRLSDEGDAKSQYLLANCYFKGDGVVADKNKAVELYEKAAKQGHFTAMIALINRYTLDSDIQKNWSKAYYWYKKAWLIDKKRLGIVHPNLINGEQMYLEAQNGDEDALAKYIKAAEMGFIEAYRALGDLNKDNPSCFDYYTKSTEYGDYNSYLGLSYCYKYGIGTIKDDSQVLIWEEKYNKSKSELEVIKNS